MKKKFGKQNKFINRKNNPKFNQNRKNNRNEDLQNKFKNRKLDKETNFVEDDNRERKELKNGRIKNLDFKRKNRTGQLNLSGKFKNGNDQSDSKIKSNKNKETKFNSTDQSDSKIKSNKKYKKEFVPPESELLNFFIINKKNKENKELNDFNQEKEIKYLFYLIKQPNFDLELLIFIINSFVSSKLNKKLRTQLIDTILSIYEIKTDPKYIPLRLKITELLLKINFFIPLSYEIIKLIEEIYSINVISQSDSYKIKYKINLEKYTEELKTTFFNKSLRLCYKYLNSFSNKKAFIDLSFFILKKLKKIEIGEVLGLVGKIEKQICLLNEGKFSRMKDINEE